MYTPIVIKFYFSVNYDEIESNRCSNVVVKYNVNIKVYFYECKLILRYSLPSGCISYICYASDVLSNQY